MEIELERTFLLKNIPAGLEKCDSVEICSGNRGASCFESS
jgi:hypothetical protein